MKPEQEAKLRRLDIESGGLPLAGSGFPQRDHGQGAARAYIGRTAEAISSAGLELADKGRSQRRPLGICCLVFDFTDFLRIFTRSFLGN